MDDTDQARVTWFVRGQVQGVGFRWWVRSQALELGLVGHARNMEDGRVEVVAQGPPETLEALGRALEEHPSATGRPGRVQQVARQDGTPRDGLTTFVEM